MLTNSQLGLDAKRTRKSISVQYLTTLLILSFFSLGNSAFGVESITPGTATTAETEAFLPVNKNENEISPAQQAAPDQTIVPSSISAEAQPAIKDQLSLLEKKLFLQESPHKPEEERLSRLEDFVFGSKGSGDPQKRLQKLEKAFPGKSTSEQTAKNDVKAPEPKPKSLLQIINSGIDNYNRHRYHNAEDDFELACAMAPGMSRVHAYMAVTKLQINERQSAIDAFRTCYELDPFGTYGRYARHCLVELAGDEAIRQKGPVDSHKILDYAISKIDRQSSDEISRHSQFGASYSNLRGALGRMQVNKISNDMYNMPWDSPSNQLTQKSNYARTDSYVQSMKAANDATARAASAEESANNLKHLLASKPLYGGAKLRAWGTNLNARYYGRETWNLAPHYIPREHPLALKLAAASIKKVPPKKVKSYRIAKKSPKKSIKPKKAIRHSTTKPASIRRKKTR